MKKHFITAILMTVVTTILLGIWTAGLIVSLSRLASGLYSVRLLRHTATPLHPDRIRSVAAALEQQFRRSPPPSASPSLKLQVPRRSAWAASDSRRSASRMTA